ncbi:hypothetical protein BJX61DRAFT_506304 [Aspergillus egyptiacus]|nr:hypothetical protein BJX61DRAFT_506304 [Aspergillus egyptiacus]
MPCAVHLVYCTLTRTYYILSFTMADRDSEGEEYQTGSETETTKPPPEQKSKKPDTKTNPKKASDPKTLDEQDDVPPTPPWGNRGVTSLRAGTKRPPQDSSSINIRIDLDLRADVSLELHAVLQGEVAIGLF